MESAERVYAAPPVVTRVGVRERLRAVPFPVVLGAILIMSVALRAWHLGAKPLWFDEAWSVFIAPQPVETIPHLLRLYDHLPPLYYMLLNIWISLFGTAESAVRLPSVLAGVGAVGATFLLAERVAGRRVALLAAALLAISPFQIAASQEARTYAFVTLFGLGAAYGLWRAVEEDRRVHWLLYAGSLLLGLYTHHFAFLLVPAYGAFVLFAPERRKVWWRWVAWTAGVGILYLPWVPAFIAQLGSARGWPEIRPAFDLYFLSDLLGLFSFGGQIIGMGSYYRRGVLRLEYRPALLLPFLFLVIAGVWGLRNPRARALLLSYWAVPLLIAASISLQWRLFFERYFSFILPPFVILMAAGIVALRDAARPQARGATVAALLAYLLAFSVPALAAFYRAPATSDWRAAGKLLTTSAAPEDLVLFVPAFTRIPFEYYFQGPQTRIGLNPREVSDAPAGGPKRHVVLRVEADPRQLEAMARKHPQLWVVVALGLGTDLREGLAPALTPFFRRSDERTFGQLAVTRWESKIYDPTSTQRRNLLVGLEWQHPRGVR